MNWVLLLLVVCGLGIQTVSQKEYNMRTGGGALLFSGASSLFAALFFVISSRGGLSFTSDTLIYSFFFAIAYGTSLVGAVLAIKTGPLSFTSLIVSYSLIIPTFYGIFFLNESMSLIFVIGLVLLFASLALINCDEKGEEKKINAKWILFVLLAFLGNGMCAVVQKIQQDAFSGGYKDEFMIVALIMVFVSLAVTAVFTERKQILPGLRGSKWFIIYGLSNGAVNLFVMILTGRMNVSLMFPFISAGGVVIAFVLSRLIYKETFSKKQKIGFVLGILAIIVLNF